ncbi:MAG: glycosyltransferase [Methanoregula sp.]|jgi:glycosyltransferase involved in cell wall biosynthesis
MNPYVTVVMPVYNADEYLGEAIDSILNQTFKDFEFIIICDDPSSKTREIINLYQNSDDRIKVIYQKKEGLVSALNKGISMAKGKYIARMDADDISDPFRFEKQVNFLELHPDVGVIGTYMKEIDENGNPNPLSTFEPPKEHDLIAWRMLFDCCVVAHPTVMLRKTLFDGIDGYNPHFIHVEDTELWSRLVFITQFSNLPEFLFSRRWHKNSICNQYADIQMEKSILIRHKLFEKILQKGVNEKDAKTFLNARNQKEVVNAKNVLLIETLMQELFRAFKKNSLKNKKNLPKIRRDIINQLFNLIHPSMGFLEIFSIIKIALKIDLIMTFYKIIQVIYRHK